MYLIDKVVKKYCINLYKLYNYIPDNITYKLH